MCVRDTRLFTRHTPFYVTHAFKLRNILLMQKQLIFSNSLSSSESFSEIKSKKDSKLDLWHAVAQKKSLCVHAFLRDTRLFT